MKPKFDNNINVLVKEPKKTMNNHGKEISRLNNYQQKNRINAAQKDIELNLDLSNLNLGQNVQTPKANFKTPNKFV